MNIKLTIREWTQFWKELGDDWYIDDSTFPEDMPHENTMTIEGDGELRWQSRNSCSETQNEMLTRQEREQANASFSKVFKRWRKKQACRTFCVQIPREKTDEFEKVVKALKGDIIS